MKKQTTKNVRFNLIYQKLFIYLYKNKSFSRKINYLFIGIILWLLGSLSLVALSDDFFVKPNAFFKTALR